MTINSNLVGIVLLVLVLWGGLFLLDHDDRQPPVKSLAQAQAEAKRKNPAFWRRIEQGQRHMDRHLKLMEQFNSATTYEQRMRVQAQIDSNFAQWNRLYPTLKTNRTHVH